MAMVYSCEQCNGHWEIDGNGSGIETVECSHCGFETRLIPVRPFDKSPVEPPQSIEPLFLPESHAPIQPTNQVADFGEAEQLHLQATFRLHECQAHYRV